MASIQRIALGFIEDSDDLSSKRFKYKFFPTKVGGKPAWLGLAKLPDIERLKCSKCGVFLTFLVQIYVPWEQSEETFHRTLFLFVCNNETCGEDFRAFRCQLKRANSFYSYSPPNYEDLNDYPDDPNPEKFGSHVCNLCGLPASQHCGKCKSVFYCCRIHQIIDWRKGEHKKYCGKSLNGEDGRQIETKYLLPEHEVTVDMEENVDQVKSINGDEDSDDDEEEDENSDKSGDKKDLVYWLEKYKPEFQNENLDEYVSGLEVDKVFANFRSQIKDKDDQIFRYYYSSADVSKPPPEPLWICDSNKPSDIPNCPVCGSERIFEFQVMPQLIYQLKAKFDFGILAIYTCKRNCSPQIEGDYLEEYIWTQKIE